MPAARAGLLVRFALGLGRWDFLLLWLALRGPGPLFRLRRDLFDRLSWLGASRPAPPGARLFEGFGLLGRRLVPNRSHFGLRPPDRGTGLRLRFQS